jgi:hypothetical protein
MKPLGRQLAFDIYRELRSNHNIEHYVSQQVSIQLEDWITLRLPDQFVYDKMLDEHFQ